MSHKHPLQPKKWWCFEYRIFYLWYNDC